MGLLDLFDEAFDLYKANFALFTLTTALVYVPVFGVGSYLAAPILNGLSLTDANTWQRILEFAQGDLVRLSGVILVFALAMALMLGALATAASARYLDQPITVAAAFRRALPITIQTAVLLAAYGICTVVGLATCVVPGLIMLLLGIPMQTIVHVMVNENVRHVLRPIRRSWNLSNGQGGFLLGGYFIHSILLLLLLIMAIGAVDIILARVVESATPLLPLLAIHKNIADTIAAEISLMLLLPYHICVVTMFYFHLRITKEGYDMEILARSLDYPRVAIPAAAPARPAVRRGKLQKQ